MKAQVLIALLLAWLLSAAGAGFAGWLYGRTQAKAAAVQACQQADINALQAVIDQVDVLGKQARAENLILSKTIADRKKADEQTTKDFKHALSLTASQRVECVFDDNSVQQLGKAADRADAAAAGGFGRALPTGTPAQ